MNEVKKCPKCHGKMVRDSELTWWLDDAFRWTIDRILKYDLKIQTYICENCGYIEFYKERKE